MKNNSVNLVNFEQIGQVADDVYMIYDPSSGTFNYISSAFQKVWQRSAPEYLDNPRGLLNTIHPEDRTYLVNFLQRTVQKLEQEQTNIEFRILVDEDTVKFILLKVYPLTSDAGTPLIAGIACDMTTAKTNIFYAEKINARKNATLEVLAHDLKTPLGMINMMASAIQKHPSATENQTIKQYVDLIQKLCERNITLIRDIVDQEFMESTAVDLRKERADIVFGINDVIDNYKKSSDIIKKEFRVSSTSEKLYFEFDTLKLMQVINNMVSNAMKFTHDNGLIEVDITELPGSVRITLRDNGIGIPEEFHQVLFERFTPARRPGLKGEKPVGLGMSICKTIVELHGGKIWFESRVNSGSTFFIEIPK